MLMTNLSAEVQILQEYMWWDFVRVANSFDIATHLSLVKMDDPFWLGSEITEPKYVLEV